ncbi:ABC transporter substrate-binding protein [Xylanibacillus composti]|uniref:Sugar ABC transporter substrate-binding protein n=1 Tax=Xylanibacillus composti TaxID=1572762 RepID=A0A8J4H355_9BACL|nr:sugar ABC transporter substrate-binding protein [Xylanibacillus composti]GIQ70093.1 sugar ABC transporter substrate-binding protein [Xylanibacillus composti]
MRKLAVLLLALVLVATACSNASNTENQQNGDTGNSEAGQTTVTWWVPNWDEAVAKELIAKFEAANPGVKVEIVTMTWDTMENQIRVSLMSKEAPDVITELESRVKNLASQNLLMNLDGFYDEHLDKDDFIASALEINTYEGSIYGVPFRHDGSGVLYNKTMFEEAGLDPDHFPETWDEFVTAMELLTKDTNGDGTIDQYALAWPLGNQANAVTRFIQLLYSEGGDILNEDGTRSALNSPEAVEALEKLVATIKNGYAPTSTMELDNTTLRGLFVNERIAAYIGGQFDIAPIQEENPNIQLGTAVIPGPNGMGTSTVNGFSLIVPEQARQKEAAMELVKFIAEPEHMAELTATFPGTRSALEHEKFADPLLKPFADQLEQGKSEPSYANWPAMEKAIFEIIQAVVLTDSPIEDAVKMMSEAVDNIISQ